jgi:formamidopyrimidine-DNA glycosylase
LPELPEVETIVRDIRPRILGRKFLSVTLSHDDVLRSVSRRRLLRDLVGRSVTGMSRRAKHAVIELGDQRLVIQPGMTGALLVYPRRPSADLARYNVLTIRMDNGRYLVYEDVRRLGTILLLNPPQWERYDESIGPEPLDPAYLPTDFATRFKRSRQAIKKALMDQKFIAGVGNIYANEALFAAGVDPSKPAAKVSDQSYSLLLRELRRILQTAIDAQGTTIRDYRTGTGESGTFQLELLVYGREHQPCRRCGTRLVGTHDIDARTTVFCYRCQT